MYNFQRMNLHSCRKSWEHMICHLENRCVHWSAPSSLLILQCILIYSSHHILINSVIHPQGHHHHHHKHLSFTLQTLKYLYHQSWSLNIALQTWIVLQSKKNREWKFLISMQANITHKYRMAEHLSHPYEGKTWTIKSGWQLFGKC